jgi:alkaline phosphatase D
MVRLLASRPNYAIWDDHDYGPNDADRTYPLRGVALSLFLDHWPNPMNHRESGGIYTAFEYGDAAFFLVDDRWFRAPNALRDEDKPFLGEDQLQWLVESLASTEKPWKFLVCGNQVINTMGTKECYRSYSGEFRRLFTMLRGQKVEGLIVLSGDRHFSELLCDSTLLEYPVYELTCSAVTSSVHLLKEKEKNNPLRVSGSLVQHNNFSRLSIRGPRTDRRLIMEHLDASGRVLWRYELALNSLKVKKP